MEEIQNITDKLVILGAGNTSGLYAKCFFDDGLQIAGFADNDVRKHNKSFLGRYNVVPAQDIKQRYGENVLIVISSAIDRVYWSIARSWMSLVINILQQMLIFSSII